MSTMFRWLSLIFIAILIFSFDVAINGGSRRSEILLGSIIVVSLTLAVWVTWKNNKDGEDESF